MVELSDDEYKQLVKDADDNREIQRILRAILRWLALILLFVVFMLSYGCHAIDMQKQRDNAYIQVEVRDIQSQGMSHEEYIEWLEASK